MPAKSPPSGLVVCLPARAPKLRRRSKRALSCAGFTPPRAPPLPVTATLRAGPGDRPRPQGWWCLPRRPSRSWDVLTLRSRGAGAFGQGHHHPYRARQPSRSGTKPGQRASCEQGRHIPRKLPPDGRPEALAGSSLATEGRMPLPQKLKSPRGEAPTGPNCAKTLEGGAPDPLADWT